MVYILNGTPNIKGNTITNGSYGIWINGGESIVEGNTISNVSSYGLYIASGGGDIENNTISNSGAHGVYISTTGNVVFSGNIVDSNGGTYYDGLFVTNGTGKIINNEIKNNAKNGIYLMGGSFEIKDNNIHDNVVSEIGLYNMEYLLSKYDFDIYEDNGIISNAYYVEKFDISSMTGTILKKTKDIVVIDGGGLASGKELKIESGNIIKVGFGKNIIISGKLEAIGTVEQPIVFTSINDHSVGGSTGTGTPAVGDWGYIKFNGSGSDGSVMDNVHLRYAGIVWTGVSYGIIRTYNSSVIIKNSLIKKSKGYGVRLENGASILENNNIVNCANLGVKITGESSTVKNNILYNNTSYGIYNSSGTPTVINNLIYGSTDPAYNLTLDSTNITGQDPLFTDESSENYYLQDTSPAKDAGDCGGEVCDIGIQFGSTTETTTGGEYLLKIYTATISGVDGKTLSYEWSFVQDPTDGVNPPVITDATGTLTEDGVITCDFTLERLGVYEIKLSFSENGEEIESLTNIFTIIN